MPETLSDRLPSGGHVCCGGYGEHWDWCAAVRLATPLGARREHTVSCSMCGRQTWRVDAICQTCFVAGQASA